MIAQRTIATAPRSAPRQANLSFLIISMPNARNVQTNIDSHSTPKLGHSGNAAQRKPSRVLVLRPRDGKPSLRRRGAARNRGHTPAVLRPAGFVGVGADRTFLAIGN